MSEFSAEPERVYEPTENLLLSILELRSARSDMFGCDLFSNPAWDILLELFAARCAHRRVGLDDLSSLAAASTIARWVMALEENGLIVCSFDSSPKDHLLIELTGECAAQITRYIRAARRLAR